MRSAGLRFGYLMAQPQMIRELIKVKDSYNCDAISIAGATAAIDDQEWLAENRGKILATRARMTEALRANGFRGRRFASELRVVHARSTPVKPVYRELKQAGVLVRYMVYPGWGDGLRITVGTDEQVDACLGLLKGLV